MNIHSLFPANATEQMDQRLHATVARATSSVSPTLVLLSYIDWATHLAAAPGKRLDLLQLAIGQSLLLSQYLEGSAMARLAHMPGQEPAPNPVKPPESDWRFNAPEWQAWPYNLLHQSYLLSEQWWNAATSDIYGVSPHHAKVVGFAAQELLKLFSPRNFLATNPQALHRTVKEGGANLLRGGLYALDDMMRQARGAPKFGAENFAVGRNLAVTPGQVILKNDLMELIQYTPTTAQVHPEPVLIIPAWIMKYYILDLSPHNSLIKYLVGKGHTVFCISWKNPGVAERDLGMDDYLSRGFHAALAAVNAVVPERKVHALGYCLGGTLLSIAAAAMARDDDDRLASISMLAAQTDFSEPGDLSLFIDHSQVALLEAQMSDTGYLTTEQMAGAFQLLRSDYLLWSHLIETYMMGERQPMSDLMAWNADATRMPARMHSQYLRRLFLDNDLADGRYPVGGKPVALTDIRLPIFCLGTVTDHVAPWRSVYKIHLLTAAEITFVLTNGGHNAGVVNEPGHRHRKFQSLTRRACDSYLGPDEWLEMAPEQAGSWWPSWIAWLKARSSAPAAPPPMGAPKQGYAAIGPAPGRYVLEK
ncbi:PHA/PHB synthase family protein [Pollutimonas bauzanensis]|uniref:Polyhydroxyalkanoate synthase n=1 Tax=Pollutimonas bauzanensis TaxID=658167 RepID=A0A1M5WLN4_9BURK|nr:alpha/beta fold hydrolase [Pollutimonas bauzanensis]SHH88074.1 polyhydroxyalkanoate synthase [Pollutimonas bauzanensis]